MGTRSGTAQPLTFTVLVYYPPCNRTMLDQPLSAQALDIDARRLVWHFTRDMRVCGVFIVPVFLSSHHATLVASCALSRSCPPRAAAVNPADLSRMPFGHGE